MSANIIIHCQLPNILLPHIFPYILTTYQGRKDGEKMAIKQMGAGSDKDQHSSKLGDIEESMQQSNSEISELRRKLNELELLAESKLNKKQETIEAFNKKLREEKEEREILYDKVCIYFGFLIKNVTKHGIYVCRLRINLSMLRYSLKDGLCLALLISK